MIALGYSNGVNIAASRLLRRSNVLRAAAAEVHRHLTDTGHGLADGDVAPARDWLTARSAREHR